MSVIKYWQLKIDIPYCVIPLFEAAIYPHFQSVQSFSLVEKLDKRDDNDISLDEPWRILAFNEKHIDEKMLEMILEVAAYTCNFPVEDIVYQYTKQSEDWLQKNLDSFPAIEIGDIYIYGDHITPEYSSTQIPIVMNATMAFGTGKHATTKGCLLSLQYLKNNGTEIKSALDMGAGSGILSIAAAKLWQGASVYAIDIDESSVSVMNDYIQKNDVADNVYASHGDGYCSEVVMDNKPFDLIISNILANPLIEMAKDSCSSLKADGYMILSGFLQSDAKKVAAAYEACKLKVIHEHADDDWATLILKKI